MLTKVSFITDKNRKENTNPATGNDKNKLRSTHTALYAAIMTMLRTTLNAKQN